MQESCGGIMATLGTRRNLSVEAGADCVKERIRGRIEDGDAWFEDRFYDPDHPIDSDWLEDAEAGRLFVKDMVRGNLGTKRLSVNEAMIREANQYMDSKGLAPQYRLRIIELYEHVYAVRPDGDAIRLDHSLYWEEDTGFARMVDGQLRTMCSELYVPASRCIPPMTDL
ncbi:MAG: hypothetical protein SA339_01440 [Methanomassiliicoccus sp.]|nr:hypothetical protein [Methanomassiliicoccus sp.]